MSSFCIQLWSTFLSLATSWQKMPKHCAVLDDVSRYANSTLCTEKMICSIAVKLRQGSEHLRDWLDELYHVFILHWSKN